MTCSGVESGSVHMHRVAELNIIRMICSGVSNAAVPHLSTFRRRQHCPLQVFDDKNQFAEWFGDSFGKTAPGAGGEDDVAMEKRVVVIHRLHQILEPFMLRRQVQDVEGKLPPKVLSHNLVAAAQCQYEYI